MPRFFPRQAAAQVLEGAAFYPAVTITGPRQSGKTTLARELFPGHEYVSLEKPAVRRMAVEDPDLFLEAHPAPVVIDEVQRAPALLSSIEVAVDEGCPPGSYVLTGSRSFLMMDECDQSLAGRTSVTELLPLSLEEMKDAGIAPETPWEWVVRGGYPRLAADPGFPPRRFYREYALTYVEKDVGDDAKVRRLAPFRRAMEVSALCVGSLVNRDSMARDVGVSNKTMAAWASIMESTYVTFDLPPLLSNRIKRLVKAPKLYFTDTGLACFEAGVASAGDLAASGSKGHLFENAVVAEAVKWRANTDAPVDLSFSRDGNGRNEVDLVIERLHAPAALVEAKATASYNGADFANLRRVGEELGVPRERRYVVHAGDRLLDTREGTWVPWSRMDVIWDAVGA